MVKGKRQREIKIGLSTFYLLPFALSYHMAYLKKNGCAVGD